MSLTLSIVKIIVLLLFVSVGTSRPQARRYRAGAERGVLELRHDLAHLAIAAIGSLHPYDVALRARWLAAAFQIFCRTCMSLAAISRASLMLLTAETGW